VNIMNATNAMSPITLRFIEFLHSDELTVCDWRG
jgi:hypothetical protein